jgi:hypothetical protein
VDPSPVPLGGVPTFTVTDIRAVGGALYEVFIIGPDGARAVVVLGERTISVRNVELSAAAVSVLWTLRRGAVPLAIGP